MDILGRLGLSAPTNLQTAANENPFFLPATKDRILSINLDKLQLLVEEIFSVAANGISSSFLRKETVPLFRLPQSSICSVLHARPDSHDIYHLFAFIEPLPDDGATMLWLLRYHAQQERWEIAGSTLPSYCKHVSSVTLYKNTSLIVLSSPDNGMHSFIPQLSIIRCIYPCLLFRDRQRSFGTV